MNILFRIKTYINYLLKAGNAHGLHSPFVFDLYCNEISNNKIFYAFGFIERLRTNLLSSENKISIHDLGAGTNGQLKTTRKIKDIANKSLSNQKTGELLFKLVNKFQPKNVIEIGTSLGISTLYLSLANSKTNVYTLEGSEAILKIAKQQFEQSLRKNIIPILGDFNTTLKPLLEKLDSVDLVFFDGNHQYEPTMQYFEACLKKINEQTLFIFDDIYWSPEMKKAWDEIASRPEVKISIDLYDLGLIFFRNNQAKQHFVLKF